jgi:hypothetical protein
MMVGFDEFRQWLHATLPGYSINLPLAALPCCHHVEKADMKVSGAFSSSGH